MDFSNLLKENNFTNEKIGLIGIPTMDRPFSLKRLLESFQPEYFNDFAGKIIIVDSSIKHANACRKIVREFQHKISCQIVYRHLRDIDKLIKLFTSQIDIDTTTLQIAFSGQPNIFSAGGARNQLLLFQNGRSSIQIDDDIILNYKKRIDYNEKLTVTPNNPLEIKTYIGKEDIDNDLVPISKNPLYMYEEILNLLNSAAVGRLNNDSDDFLTQRIASPSAHLLNIQNGLYGDSSVKRYFAVHQLAQKNNNLFSSSNKNYDNLKNSTNVIQSAISPSLTDNSICTTSYIAINGSYIFPPFPPTGRGEDFLAGVLASQCCVGSLSLHLGTLVSHQRDTILPMSDISNLALPPSNRILAAIIGQPVYTGKTEENIETAGNIILEFSNTSPETFQDYLTNKSKEIWQASILEFEQAVISHAHLPPVWQNDMKDHIKNLKQSYLSTTKQIIERVGNQKQWSSIQKSYSAYGSLLTKWPLLWTSSLSVNLEEI